MELLHLWALPQTKRLRVLDMGCGLGGSSRFLYRHLTQKGKDVEIVGITLSTYQQARATTITQSAGDIPAGAVTFQTANALSTPFADQSFDLVWSLESAEHFPTKGAWLAEVKRVLVPGGTLLCATWCRRETTSRPLSEAEERLLGRISKNYALPAFVALSDYGRLAEEKRLLGFSATQQSWTLNVFPFWPAVIRSAMRPTTLLRVLASLPFGGWTTVKGAVTAVLMMQGFGERTLNFGVFAVSSEGR